MTKKEAKARKEEWTKALAEGRVVRFNDGMEFRSFKTAAAAEEFRRSLRRQDIDATIVRAPRPYQPLAEMAEMVNDTNENYHDDPEDA